MEWSSPPNDVQQTSSSTLAEDVKDIRSALIVVTRKDLSRAANTIASILTDNRNAGLKPLVMEAIGVEDKKSELNSHIVQGLANCISQHSTRAVAPAQPPQRLFIKNIRTAALFSVAKNGNVSNQRLADTLAASWYQISSARNRAPLLVDQKMIVGPYLRNTRCDFILEKPVPFVHDYCQDDDHTRLDTKQRVYEWTNPRTGETEVINKRIYRLPKLSLAPHSRGDDGGREDRSR